MLSRLLKKKITYTSEMKLQDELWENENADLDIMEKLFHQIVNEAKKKGFNGYVNIYNYSNEEVIAEVFKSKEHYELACRGEWHEDYDSTSRCKSLIGYLEEMMNK